MAWEILDRPGQPPQQVGMSGDAAIALLNNAVAEAAKLGLEWRKEPLVLQPSPQLVQLVRRSQELAAEQGADTEGGE